MSSFFIKNKNKINAAVKAGTSGKKRKFEKVKNIPTPKIKKKPQKIENDEINSDEFSSENEDNKNESFISDDEITETAQDKRLRLAKKYLEEIAKEEEQRSEAKEINDPVSKRLRIEYLDSVGKLRKNISKTYEGYNKESIQILKHKYQKLPLTIVIASNDNSVMFSGGKTSIIVKWDIATWKSIGTFDCQSVNEPDPSGKKRRPHILAMALSTDMKFLAVAEGGRNIQIWCPNELKHLKTFKGHRDTVTSLVFRKDSYNLYSGSKDRSVKVWSLDEMVYVESLFGHQSSITGIDALSRERAITSGGIDCSVRIWKITEESQLIYNGHSGSIEGVKLINDENFLSCGDDGSLCLWSTLKKKPLHIENLAHGKAENGDANWISAITCLVNTDLIASGSCDGFIRLWQMLDNPKKLVPLFEIPVKGFVNCLAFTQNGSHLIAAVGQEHKLGRWWKEKEAKNGIHVIELKCNKAS